MMATIWNKTQNREREIIRSRGEWYELCVITPLFIKFLMAGDIWAIILSHHTYAHTFRGSQQISFSGINFILALINFPEPACLRVPSQLAVETSVRQDQSVCVCVFVCGSTCYVSSQKSRRTTAKMKLPQMQHHSCIVRCVAVARSFVYLIKRRGASRPRPLMKPCE